MNKSINDRLVVDQQHFQVNAFVELLYKSFIHKWNLYLSSPNNLSNDSRTSLYTSSTGLLHETVFTLFCFSNASITGKLVSRKTANRFLMDSILSSMRPELSPRFNNRCNMISSGHSKYKTTLEGTTYCSNSCQPCTTHEKSPLCNPTYNFLKLESLIHLSRETINQKTGGL